MYTLRTLKDPSKISRTQIYLGDSYTIEEVSEKEKESGIKLRVHGNWDSHTEKGIAIWNEDHAYIMTQMGETFETLNRPPPLKPTVV